MKVKEKRFLSPLLILLLSLLFVTIVLQILLSCSRPFADFFNTTVAAFFRFIMAKLFALLPFSVAEILLILIPLWLFLLIFFGVRSLKREKAFRRYVTATLSLPIVLYFLFTVTLSPGYKTTPIRETLHYPEAEITEDSLLRVAEWAASEAARLSDSFPKDPATGATKMPYTWQDMTEKLNESYAALSGEFTFLQSHRTPLKQILLSDPMTYTGIVGVYTFFTGESNVNVTYPDYSTVFTAAHEMAHQRGIAKENEANFIAFLVCIGANDDYLRYVGYMNILNYLGNAIYATGESGYKRFLSLYNDTMQAEEAAYLDVYYAHQNTWIRDLASGANDTYLKAQGTPGKISYSLVVTLAVSFYESNIAN